MSLSSPIDMSRSKCRVTTGVKLRYLLPKKRTFFLSHTSLYVYGPRSTSMGF